MAATQMRPHLPRQGDRRVDFLWLEREALLAFPGSISGMEGARAQEVKMGRNSCPFCLHTHLLALSRLSDAIVDSVRRT